MSLSDPPAYVGQALYSSAEIKLIEQNAADKGGFELYSLMEKAGLSALKKVNRHWPEIKQITIVCGKGNNAGDGFVLARLAAEAGLVVQVLLVESEPEFKGDALTAYQTLTHQKTLDSPEKITIKQFKPSLLEGQPLIIDAILGTGICGALRDNYKQVVESINDFVESTNNKQPQSTAVFSIDIPTGLESDTGFANPLAIKASRTLTFVALKSGMVTGYARACCGIIELDDLGLNETETLALERIKPRAWLNDADALIASLPKRSNVSHKGDHGHLLLVGGDFGFGGAILMSAMAAARCGTGKLTILTRDAHIAPILTQCPEAMIRSIESVDEPILEKVLSEVDAIVIGPGLGQEDWGKSLLAAVCASKLPLLVDADALNIIANDKDYNEHCLGTKPWVMTPHPGEAARLLDTNIALIEKNRYQSAEQLQKKFSAVIVLKGAGTIIADNENHITVCDEGNPGMASAGMGDILTGIIGALLAQKVEVGVAARIGVALHARAGDLAAMNGQKGLMATDLIGPLRMLVNQ